MVVTKAVEGREASSEVARHGHRELRSAGSGAEDRQVTMVMVMKCAEAQVGKRHRSFTIHLTI